MKNKKRTRTPGGQRYGASRSIPVDLQRPALVGVGDLLNSRCAQLNDALERTLTMLHTQTFASVLASHSDFGSANNKQCVYTQKGCQPHPSTGSIRKARPPALRTRAARGRTHMKNWYQAQRACGTCLKWPDCVLVYTSIINLQVLYMASPTRARARFLGE